MRYPATNVSAISSRPLLSIEAGPGCPRAAGFPALGEDVLCVVRYGNDGCQPPATAAPFVEVPNRVLGGTSCIEVWRGTGGIERGHGGEIDWAQDGEILVGAVSRPLTGHLTRESRSQFAAILDLAEERRAPHLLRVWNYLPGINDSEDGVERYRLFNIGRAKAFEERFGVSEAERHFAASSAVGSPGDSLVTVFLASRSPCQYLENPRQLAAFRYPAAYGPKSPSFSRGTVAAEIAGSAFFLAGTASIVGHETWHHGALEAQVEETLRNIEAVLLEARSRSGLAIPRIEGFDAVKVYLRHAADLERARAAIEKTEFAAPVVYLEAGICRGDLLVEIEGLVLAAKPAGS
jgi:chorismate lyase / 3-hydroxybenzoate synthase